MATMVLELDSSIDSLRDRVVMADIQSTAGRHEICEYNMAAAARRLRLDRQIIRRALRSLATEGRITVTEAFGTQPTIVRLH